ncbi:hypothetical protein VN1279_00020 [Helicobacter pylori]|uniref:hypothetical protein n=1 Tax=Helicobacter pylori TaxID=210 RepID=UPI000EAF196C|nr:hypothetical protein [Helicobacter pylori]GHR89457.1 hypothetical protein VN1279_00020 [Helicobacter pylori]
MAKYTHKEFREMLAKKAQEYSKEYKVKFYTANQSVEKHWYGLLKSFVIDLEIVGLAVLSFLRLE